MAGFRTGRSSNLVPVVMILLVSTKNQDRWELSEGEAASMTAATLPMYRSHLLNLNARIWSQWNQDFLAPFIILSRALSARPLLTKRHGFSGQNWLGPNWTMVLSMCIEQMLWLMVAFILTSRLDSLCWPNRSRTVLTETRWEPLN